MDSIEDKFTTLHNRGEIVATIGQRIREDIAVIFNMLLEKNAAHGNSALQPLRVFSKAPMTEQIAVRIDDKLSRLRRGSDAGEDVTADLIGYLWILAVAAREIDDQSEFREEMSRVRDVVTSKVGDLLHDAAITDTLLGGVAFSSRVSVDRRCLVYVDLCFASVLSPLLGGASEAPPDSILMLSAQVFLLRAVQKHINPSTGLLWVPLAT